MDYQIIETRGVSGVFPKPFDGTPSAVVAVGWRGKLYTATGQPLEDASTLAEFCTRIGIRPEAAKPRREHTSFLVGFRDTHFPRKDKKPGKSKKPKGKKDDKPKEPPRELTPEEKRHREVLRRLQEEFPSTGRPGGDDRRRGKRGGKPPTKIKFAMEDKHGRTAEAINVGGSKFEPVQPREGGTKTIARNRWAARVLAERYIQIDGDLYAEELEAAKPTEPPADG